MLPVVTITFNPCIDKSTSVPALIPEKKLVCAIPKVEPGGGGINVARAIKKLGGEAVAIYPAGGYTGQFFTGLLQKENVKWVVIPIAEETRENIIVKDEATNQQFRFGMPGPTITENEWRQCIMALEGIREMDFIVASGSLTKGVPADIFATLARIAKTKKAKLVVDTSGEPLLKAAQEGVYLLKPNLAELCKLSGRENINNEKVEEVAKEIIEKQYCEVIIVSMGAGGAVMATKEGVSRIVPPVVKIQSTVGAGDSMVAGVIYYLSQGKSLAEAARYGVACGTAATLNPGTELCRKEDADKLYPLVNSYTYPMIDACHSQI